MKRIKWVTYTLMALFAIVVSKYLLLWWMPATSLPKRTTTPPATYDKPKEVELYIDYSELKPTIEKEYRNTQKDIFAYIDEALNKQKKQAYYNLSKDDGFLEWIFGYVTGYQMMWKKLKGIAGSDDNEVKMVTEQFNTMVMEPGYAQTLQNIQNYVKNRTTDYYKSVIVLTSEYLNKEVQKLKQQGFTTIEVAQQQVPWNNYIVTTGLDGFMILEMAGLSSVSIFVGKMVGGKVATLLGPKMIGLLSGKAASIVAGKIVASFSLLFAPVVDYAMNEGAKALQYEKTKKEFEEIIDESYAQINSKVKQQMLQVLIETKNEIYKELNKNTTIKAVQ